MRNYLYRVCLWGFWLSLSVIVLSWVMTITRGDLKALTIFVLVFGVAAMWLRKEK
jgi:hypothetical protein